jgi:hypothetical protein
VQLELISWEPEDLPRVFEDYNRGRYDKAKDYYWEWAVSGCGTDVFMWNTMITVFFVTKDDVALFPALADYVQVMVWEDEEEGVKMLMLRPEAKCIHCKDTLLGHTLCNCDGLI